MDESRPGLRSVGKLRHVQWHAGVPLNGMAVPDSAPECRVRRDTSRPQRQGAAFLHVVTRTSFMKRSTRLRRLTQEQWRRLCARRCACVRTRATSHTWRSRMTVVMKPEAAAESPVARYLSSTIIESSFMKSLWPVANLPGG